MRHRRVLMISCAFPPTGGPGVQRSVKFAKYLPACGWFPTVWACDPLEGMPRDPSLLDDLPADVIVHRRGCHDRTHTARKLVRFMQGGGAFASRVGAALDWRLDNWLTRNPLPDPFISWAQSSVEPLVNLIRHEHIDAVYSTFSPASNHVLGLALNRRTGLPWIADFRDLWTDDYRYNESSPARRNAHRELEQEILEAADLVIGVTDRQTALLASRVPAKRHKFYTITNGFDPVDFDIIEPPASRHPGRFVLAHVGRFDRWRTGDPLFDGLKRFASDLGSRIDRFVLRIVGHADESTLQSIRATGLDCAFTGYVSHAEAVQEMFAADGLLLCVPGGPNGDTVIPAKLFEYLASGRPILGVGPEHGVCEEILSSCHGGFYVPDQPGAIATGISRLFAAWRAKTPLPGSAFPLIERFTRDALTRELAALMDDLVGRRPDEPPHDGELMEAVTS
jgi:glycosyltransferase involved in cell wall biosynthesis